MTDVIVYPGRTDDCDGMPGMPPSPLPEPIVRPPFVLPLPSDAAWLDPDTVRQIAALTDPTRDELTDLYGTADPAELRRMPFVLAEDIAAADRYAAEQVPA